MRFPRPAALLFLVTVGCTETPGPESEALPPVNESCRALCCLETESPCATRAASRCERCDERCRGGCADGAPLRQCMEASSAHFVCPSAGGVAPPEGSCAAEFATYQTKTQECGPASASIGYEGPPVF